MQFFPPAKINLSFRILRRRDDGFHEIVTLMAPISLCDELSLERVGEPGIAFVCNDGSLGGEGNLVVRAARSFCARIKVEPSLKICLTKKIPHGAGLGGGSSDAASTLLGLNQMHGQFLPLPQLTEIAAELGSDVPFFLAQSAAVCRGRGEIVQPISLPKQLPLLLLKPAFSVPTPWAYSHWSESRELPGIPYALQQLGDAEFVNDLERPVFEKHLFLAHMKRWLLEQPEVAAALMSGSGSTLFAVLRDGVLAESLGERARAELDPELWTCACETLLAS